MNWRKISIILLAVLSAHCTLKKPETDRSVYHDAHSGDMVPKAFFVKKGTGLSADRLIGKTFLCGFAAENTSGRFADGFVYYQMSGHCNIQFEITENALIGKLINPSFPDDRRRWKDAIVIPIIKHFYWEKAKDERGRETDVFVESQRSHWSARPLMALDLKNIQLKDLNMQIYDNPYDYSLFPGSAEKIEDVEWDHKAGFLGFSLRMSHPIYGADVQMDVRFNFLEFEHDTTFKPTPFNMANNRYFNVLHILGKKANGTDPVLYAGKWNTKKKHEIHLVGFPEEYQSIAKEVVEQWNDVFAKIGQGRPLVPVISQPKHPFDLRRTTVTWVEDRRWSYSAPLGVGMALADVRNGEIKWGAVTLWGGLLDMIINRDMPIGGAASAALSEGREKPFVQFGLMDSKTSVPNARPAVPLELSQVPHIDSLKTSLAQSMSIESQRLAEQLAGKGAPGEDDVKIAAQRKELLDQTLSKQNHLLDTIALDYQNVAGRMQQLSQQLGSAQNIYNSDFLQDLIGMPSLKESLNFLPINTRLTKGAGTVKDLNTQGMRDLFERSMHNDHLDSRNTFCFERSFADVADNWSLGIAQHKIDKYSATRALVKDLLLHEIGHMLGLGHNFKENILPEKSEIPAKYYQPLEKKAKSTMTNYSTVMGYKDGLTDVLTPFEDLKPGPMDELVLRYIYNSTYSILPEGDAASASDFEFEPVRADGRVRETVEKNGRKYRVAYFPACNDATASFSLDPYCNRWDRGYSASTIVDSYFNNFKGNLVSQLFAFSNSVKGGNYYGAEARLWGMALNSFGRSRLFYDYMRQKYSDDLAGLMSTGGEQSSKNLLEFSQACQATRDGKPIENPHLERLFKNNRRAELADLCLASLRVVSELDSLLQLPGKDYTEIDYFDSYLSAGMLGGEATSDWSRAWGSWKSVARTPIKISALFALTNPYPYMYYYGWLLPINRYSRQDGAYHLSTFFPKEYTSAIASATEMNLTFGNTSVDKSTTIGQTVLSLGYFMQNAYRSNDILSAYTPFIENIRNQADFRYSMAVVEIVKKDEDGKELARKFSGTIYNIYSRGPETVPEVYIYTNDRTVTMPTPRSLLLPLTSVRWWNGTTGYYYGIKMDYADDFYDRLKTKSVRKTLEDAYYEVMKKCVQGENRNGLRYFFNDTVTEALFPGFTFPNSIHTNPSDKNKFFVSVEDQFKNYYENKNNHFVPAPNPAYCEEAIRGQGLLVMAASVLNGYYFPQILDFIEKGY